MVLVNSSCFFCALYYTCAKENKAVTFFKRLINMQCWSDAFGTAVVQHYLSFEQSYDVGTSTIGIFSKANSTGLLSNQHNHLIVSCMPSHLFQNTKQMTKNFSQATYNYPVSGIVSIDIFPKDEHVTNNRNQRFLHMVLPSLTVAENR